MMTHYQSQKKKASQHDAPSIKVANPDPMDEDITEGDSQQLDLNESTAQPSTQAGNS